MKDKSVQKRERAVLRERVGDVLARDGNRLLLIEALSVCTLFVALYGAMSYAFAAISLFADSALLFFLLFALLYPTTRFLIAPTLLGVFYITARLCKGESVLLIDLFRFFSSREHYRTALRATDPAAGAIWVAFFLGTVMNVAFSSMSAPPILAWLLCTLCVTAVTVILLLLISRSYPFARIACTDKTLSRKEWKAEARRVCPKAGRRGIRFFWRWLGWLLLGFLTMGLLWIVDVLPRMLVAYCLDLPIDE